MIIGILLWTGRAALVLLVLPSFLFLFNKTSLEVVFELMIIATLVWFSAGLSVAWLRSKRGTE